MDAIISALGYWLLAFSSFLFLLAGCRFLGRLQRIESGRTSKATTLARWFLCFHDHYVSVPVSGNQAFDQQQVLFFSDTASLRVAERDFVHAHASEPASTEQH